MATNIIRRSSRLLFGRACYTSLNPRHRQASDSAKAAFQKLFPRSSSKPKLRYDANSYGQTVGVEYPFEVEKTPEHKLKRYKTKKTANAVAVDEVIEILEEKEAVNVKVLEVPDELNYADHLVIASAESGDHLKLITQHLAAKLIASHSADDIHVEGLGSFGWTAVDAGSVVVHLFLPHIREEYNLETEWESKS